MNVEPTIGLALLAGLVSFISPCVLPLVPAYIGYMSGHATTAAGESGRGKFSTFLHGLFFVLGFTIFFVGFGLLTAAASDWLTQRGIDIPTIITRLGGVAVILFGLYVMKALDPVFRRGLMLARQMKENVGLAVGFTLVVVVILLAYYYWVFESPIGAAIFFLLTIALFYKSISRAKNLSEMWLNIISSLQIALISDTRKLDMPRRNTGYLGSTGMGIVFAAGWTPCIGPIYGSVLTLATDAAVQGDSLVRPGILLTAYSLGLGVPFLITALALNQTTGLMKSLKRNMRKVEYVSGALLILIGVLILSGSLEEITRRFGSDGSLGELSVRLETCSVGAAEGRIHLSSWRECISDGNPKLSDRIIFASKRPTSTELTSLDTSQIQDFGSPNTVEVGLEIGKRAPEFTTTTLDGKQVSLSDFQGKTVLLNFWATWCGPCRTEMPEFETIYGQYKDRGFEVLAVNFLESPEQIQPFVDEIGMSFPVLLDESGEINDDLYNVPNYPTSYVIDGNGIILARHHGILSGEQLLEILDGG